MKFKTIKFICIALCVVAGSLCLFSYLREPTFEDLEDALRNLRLRLPIIEAEERCADIAARIILRDMVPIPGRNYLIGKYEVTRGEYAAVMGFGSHQYQCRFDFDDKNFEHSNLPANNEINWDSCQGFLENLNALPSVKASGLIFRLPTAEEWEYACRAGATGEYCKLADGTEITGETLGRVAWFADNSDYKPHPVGQKEPNAFGLYDMYGNVEEWTSTLSKKDWECRLVRGCDFQTKAGGFNSDVHDVLGRNLWKSGKYLGFRLCAERRAD